MNSSADFLSSSSSFFEDPASLITGRSILGGLVTAYFVYYLLSTVKQSRKGKLPPGPKGIPIFGNMFQLTADAWVQFAEWGNQYGDLVYIRAAGHGMLILNSHKVATDIMEQRAAIYSDRPRLVVASEILTGSLLIPFAGYNDFWRRMRRASHEGLNNNTARNYYPAQLREAVLLVEGMLNDSNNWDDELKRAAQSMILGVVYDNGVIADCKDPNITYVNDFIARIVRAAFPGAHYAEFFPVMKYLPTSMAKWKRDAQDWFRRDGEYFGAMYNDVKERIKNGDERHSFAATLVHDEKQLNLSEDENAWLAATIFATGGETTSTVMSWFILAMVKYPAAAKAAQEELDRVVGRDRMPTFADRDSLPYITACVRETLRWKTVAPVGVPHRSVEDDWYEGHFIPKGTIVIPNQWAMNKDTRVYGPDADDFKPERHLDADGNLGPAPFGTHDEGHVGYGFGRRICVGRHVANNSLYMDMACLLWACNIAPVKDAKGNPVIPDSEKFVNDGLVLRPWPFQCAVTPRFPGAEEIVAATREMLTE
ncbi:cytochrome P450 [Cyathus striatus]|nr:cytochrome P450 [Cyathus striatus]